MDGLTRISMTIEESLLKQFDRLTKAEGFPTRSEAIGHLIRGALVERQWESDAEVAGVITIIYDHHKSQLLKKLVEAQHDSGSLVLCSQHAHLDHNNCLENIVVRGRAEAVKKLHQNLSAIKGIKHAALSMTTLGRNF